ncbi:MAG: glycosyltransferase [Bryobacteraceae bacterium]
MTHLDANRRLADIDNHYEAFSTLVETARQHQRQGRLESAVVRAQIAGTFAWMNPAGIFASAELEHLLAEIGAMSRRQTLRHRRTGDAGNVLHVVTQAYESGGSTQAVTSWIEQDSARSHRVALTRQAADPVPHKLAAALRSPSDLLRLDEHPDGLLGRAAALRSVAGTSDVVLLHVHPYDVVPVLAFAGLEEHPPVIFVDHADHVFWLGIGAAQTLMNMRDSGRDLAISRRGVAPSRCHVMARPLRLRDRTVSREVAKRRVDVNSEQVVILTAAAASKYRAIGGWSFLDLVVPVVERHPEVVLLAAGPSDEAEWREAGAQTGGRVRALGRVSDVAPLHQAADLYVDSFPFSSLTSLFEAGSYGNPVASFHGHPSTCQVLGADTRGLDKYLVASADPVQFQEQLSVLLTDEARRRELGRETEVEIRSTHTGQGWRRSVDDLYAFAAQQRTAPQVAVPTRSPGELDVLLELVMEQTGFSQGVAGALASNVALLPARERLETWISLAAQRQSPGLTRLIPERLHPKLARWRDRVRAQSR